MIAVCDMGPLHYLILIGCDHVLPLLFDRVVTARVVVEKEMRDSKTPAPVQLWAAAPPLWLEVLEPTEIEDLPLLGKTGIRGDGDRAIISLARQLSANVVVMDDKKARKVLKKKLPNVAPVWTLEVLDEAAERGLIDDLSRRLDDLENLTLFYVGEKARIAIEKMRRRDIERKTSLDPGQSPT